MAKKITDGVCAGAADMKVDGIEAADLGERMKWADMEDDGDSGDWIKEMWWADWEQALKEHDLERASARRVPATRGTT